MGPDRPARLAPALAPALALVACLAGCVAAPLPAPRVQASAPPACSAGPDGGPSPIRTADRGIGGTGAPASQVADRGIGGPGIVAVITGFASVCLGGQEVAYPDDVPVLLDGRPATAAELRAGQLALVAASGPEGGLRASRIAIRHEVTGPVLGLAQPGGVPGVLVVAGQRVAVSAATLGVTQPTLGAWVAVSGFRDPGGTVQATRIDLVPAGVARIAGPLVLDAARLRIGAAEIVPAPGAPLAPGQDVVVEGRWAEGRLYAGSGEPDLLFVNPAAYFGPAMGAVVIERYAGFADGRLLLGRVRQGGPGSAPSRSVVTFSRRPDGALQPATVPGLRELRPAPMPGRAAGRGLEREQEAPRAVRPYRRNEQEGGGMQGGGGPAAPMGGFGGFGPGPGFRGR